MLTDELAPIINKLSCLVFAMAKFSLTSLLLLVCLVGVALAWMSDRQRLLDGFERSRRNELYNRVLHQNYLLRLDAVNQLRELGSDAGLGPLIYALSDSRGEVRSSAEAALQDITGEDLRKNILNQNLPPGQDPIETYLPDPRPWIEWHEKHFPDDCFDYSASFRMSNRKKESHWPRH